jgi:O-antigen ligase
VQPVVEPVRASCAGHPLATAAAYWLALATLAWGLLAFGSVYPWAYTPLAAGAVAAGVLGLASGPKFAPRSLLVALSLVAASVGLQMVPLPASTVKALSPSTDAALRQIDVTYSLGLNTSRALSLQPESTAVALGLFLAFALLFVGTTSLLSRIGAESFINALVILGVVAAFAGIIQKSFGTETIYGLWTPLEGRDPFGPFVNKNHFAGWMLMVLPVALGLFCSGVARGMRGVKPGVRERMLWFSSPEANKLVLLALAASVMLLSLVLTFSRSGLLAATATVVLIGLFFLRSTSSSGAKAVLAGFLVLMIVGIFAWAGTDAISQRLAQLDFDELSGRRGAWEDAWNVARRFPLTGTGSNTYGTAMLLYQENNTAEHFSSAHNDWLQIAAEGGLLVSVPVLIVLAILVIEIRRRLNEDKGSSYYWIRAGAALGLGAIGVQEIADFSLQMPGNAAMFAVVCAMAIHKRPSRRGIAGLDERAL